VNLGAVTHFQIAGPTTATAGTGFTIMVSARDRFGNVVVGYAVTDIYVPLRPR
jgi:hypothetical protein